MLNRYVSFTISATLISTLALVTACGQNGSKRPQRLNPGPRASGKAGEKAGDINNRTTTTPPGQQPGKPLDSKASGDLKVIDAIKAIEAEMSKGAKPVNVTTLAQGEYTLEQMGVVTRVTKDASAENLQAAKFMNMGQVIAQEITGYTSVIDEGFEIAVPRTLSVAQGRVQGSEAIHFKTLVSTEAKSQKNDLIAGEVGDGKGIAVLLQLTKVMEGAQVTSKTDSKSNRSEMAMLKNEALFGQNEVLVVKVFVDDKIATSAISRTLFFVFSAPKATTTNLSQANE